MAYTGVASIRAMWGSVRRASETRSALQAARCGGGGQPPAHACWRERGSSRENSSALNASAPLEGAELNRKLTRRQGEGALIDNAPDAREKVIVQLGERAAHDDAIGVVEVHDGSEDLAYALTSHPHRANDSRITSLCQTDDVAGGTHI